MNPITKLEQKQRKAESRERVAKAHKQVRQEKHKRKEGRYAVQA